MNPEEEYPFVLQNALNNTIKKENIKCAEIILESGPGKGGEGYLGTLYKLAIEGSNKTLKIVAKSASCNICSRKYLPLRQSFLSEIYIYENVLPWFYKFQEGKLDKPLIAPKCYWSTDKEFEEMLVLEDIRTTGYENVDRLQAMDAKHVEMVLKEYSKLHALSLATKDQYPETFDKLAEGLGDNCRNWFLLLHKNIKIICEKNVHMIDYNTRKDFYNAYLELCKNIENYLLDYNYKDDPLSVFSHGDCWSNNMMFKYKSTSGIKELTNMNLIDFQLSKSSNIISDISFFLYACSDGAIWKDLYTFLEIYYDNLRYNLRKLGSDPDNILSRDDFFKLYKRNARYGLLTAAFWIRVNLMENDEAPNIQDGAKFVDDFFIEKKNEHIYMSRFKNLLNHFYEFDLLESE